ncbi:MAG: polysaccharide biosynthesis C-terminal domain-containing protein [Bacteroidota bacterium]
MYKKVASTFGIKIIVAILNLAIVIILSRLTGAEGKGEASLIITSIAMVLLFCNMIGGASLVYFVPRYNTFLLFFLSNVWSVFMALIAFATLKFFPALPEQFVTPVVILSLINSFLATNLSILLGKEKIMSNNYISLLQTVINLLVLLVLLKGFGQTDISAYINSLYAAMGICLLTSTLLIVPYLKEVSFRGSKSLLYQLAKLGLLNQAGHILKFMSFRISYYALASYSGEAVLGVYSNGISLIESLLLISNSFAAVLYPKIANSTDIKLAQTLTLQMTKMSIIFCILALIPLLLLPSEFWVWLFGNEFNGVRQVIILLSPGIVFFNITLIIGHYFSGTGKYSINMIASFIGLLITLIASLLVIPHYGIMEASIISTLSYLGIALVIMLYFAKEAQIKVWQLLPASSDFAWLKVQTKLFFNK